MNSLPPDLHPSPEDQAFRRLLAEADRETVRAPALLIERLSTLPQTATKPQRTSPDRLHALPAAMRSRRRRWAILGLVAAACMVCLVLYRPSSAWASVLAAMRAQACVHFKLESTLEQKQSWLTADTYAVQQPQFTSVLNRKSAVIETYYPEQQRIVRRRATAADQPPNLDSLLNIAGLAPGTDTMIHNMKVLDVKSRSVDFEGQKGIEYIVQLGPIAAGAEADTKSQLTVLADPKSQLPRVAILASKLSRNGRVEEFLGRIHLDYPAQGPASLYDLGVPRDTEVQDQSNPQANPLYQKIQVAMEQGRRALLTQYKACEGHDVQRPSRVIWRKGNRWRLDERGENMALKFPRGDAPPEFDVSAWRTVATGDALPQRMFDGTSTWVRGPNSTDKTIWQKLSAYQPASPEVIAEEALATLERLAFPYLRETPNHSMTVAEEPSSGLVVVELRELGPVHELVHRSERYWLEPKYNYAVVRHEQSDSQASADKFLRSGRTKNPVTLVGGYRQSAQGAWHPTCYRQPEVTIMFGNPTVLESWAYFDVDFDATVPDELFDGQIPGVGR